jgi:hypothetical protein
LRVLQRYHLLRIRPWLRRLQRHFFVGHDGEAKWFPQQYDGRPTLFPDDVPVAQQAGFGRVRRRENQPPRHISLLPSKEHFSSHSSLFLLTLISRNTIHSWAWMPVWPEVLQVSVRSVSPTEGERLHSGVWIRFGLGECWGLGLGWRLRRWWRR